ncbi:MAG: histidine phosphatase family protein [Firmicutes bacterium]|jgi:alpha-ribazole phosphatase|nr:histidine phosphatase family protein [Bacillota bacterium]
MVDFKANLSGDDRVLEVVLLRHGETAGNLAGRYVGRTDEPLHEEARRCLREAGKFTGASNILVSPLQRAGETARLLFPGVELEVCQDLREMDFGDFEGRTAEELDDDPAYEEWVEGGCTGPCPGGEGLEQFSERTCAAFDLAVRQSVSRKEGHMIVVTHGGSIMAIMNRYARPRRPCFSWYVKNCCGYRIRLDGRRWATDPSFLEYARWELFNR